MNDEKIKSGSGTFANFEPKDWIEYYTSLNKEIPVEKCKLEMTDEQKKRYVIALNSLLEDRKTCPAVRYEISYKELE